MRLLRPRSSSQSKFLFAIQLTGSRHLSDSWRGRKAGRGRESHAHRRRLDLRGRTQLSPKVERKVVYALDFINATEDTTLRDIFRLGLGSVMVSFFNYSYKPSLTRRAAVDKPNIEDANVGLSVSAKLHLVLEDIGWVHGHMRTLGHRPKSKVFPKSIFSAFDCLTRRNFIDLLVTSPPYLNNYHYPIGLDLPPALVTMGRARPRASVSSGRQCAILSRYRGL